MENDNQITILYGQMVLEKEFNWVRRKRFLYSSYQYYVHTPYLSIGPFDSYEEALSNKIRFDR